jgi:hypothetical protein
MKPKRRKRWIGLLAFAGLAALLVWTAWPREPSLLQKASKVASVAGWRPTRRFNTVCPWTWLSDRDILIVRQDEATYLGGLGRQVGLMQVCRVDVATGVETTLGPLSATMNTLRKQNPGLRLEPDGPYPSPDGKWLLWDTYSFSTPPCFLVTAMDGSSVLRWPKEPGERYNPYADELAWQQDSRAFVRLRYNRSGIGLWQEKIYRLDAPDQVRTITLPANRWGGRQLGVTPDGRMLLCNWWTAPPKRAYIAALDINTPGNAPRLYALSAPKGTECIFSLALSPKGNRMAWMISANQWPQGPAWLLRLKTWLGLRFRRNILELWVSCIDGSNMRRIGVVQDKPGRHTIPKPETCAWSPDGRQIAFTYDFKLWTVKID